MLFVSYLRLSKQLNDRNQYGIDGQRKAIGDYVANNCSTGLISKEFIEFETGSRKRKCPQLKKAIETCRNTGATLLTWKIDRLGRNLHQITRILESDINFIAVSTPNLDRFGLQILGALAEKELEDISTRIKSALYIAKQNGVKLGADKTRAKAMSKKSVAVRKKAADEFAIEIWGVIEDIKKKSRGELNSSTIADKLNRLRIFTSNGSFWYPTQVIRVEKRIRKLQREGAML